MREKFGISLFLNSFRGKLTAMVIMAVLFPLIVTSFLFGGFINELFEKNYESKLRADLEIISLTNDTLNIKLENELSSLSMDSTVAVTLELNIFPQLRKYLQDYKGLSSFSVFKVLDADRNTVFSYEGHSHKKKVNLTFSKEELAFHEKTLFANKSVPVYEKNRPRKEEFLVGYLIGARCFDDVYIEHLNNRISENFIIWYDGKPVASDIDDFSLTTDIDIKENRLGNFSVGDNEYKIMIKKVSLDEHMLTYGVLFPMSEVNNAMWQMMSLVFVVGLFVFSLITLVFNYFIKGLIDPVSKLKEAALVFEKGKQKMPELDYDRKDEFGSLNCTFRDMFLSINSYIKEIQENNQKLNNINREIETKVEERTKELNEQIVERKKAEETMKHAMLTAKKANAAKSNFLANMSHELRTPLNAINGFSEIMMEELLGKIPPQYKEYAKHINESGELLLNLIHDILDLSKIEAGKDKICIEDVDVREVAEEVLKLLQQKIEKENVTLKTFYRKCDIRADRLKVKQMLLNLLSNAVKFSTNGQVELKIRATKKNAIISVQDTGIGMTEEEIKVALEPFGQVESNPMVKKVEGTGLGLPLTKQLVEMHNGSISIESEKGKRTLVTVKIPLDSGL